MTAARPAFMITEYFWGYLSGIFRDHGIRAVTGAAVPAAAAVLVPVPAPAWIPAGGGARDA
jgi:hypothetical protein